MTTATAAPIHRTSEQQSFRSRKETTGPRHNPSNSEISLKHTIHTLLDIMLTQTPITHLIIPQGRILLINHNKHNALDSGGVINHKLSHANTQTNHKTLSDNDNTRRREDKGTMTLKRKIIETLKDLSILK